MAMPSDIGIVDTMIGFPAEDFKQYDFIRAQLKDGSKSFDFPVEYMFKQVPKALFGASADDAPEIYRNASPRHILPLSVPQVVAETQSLF